MPSVVSRRRIPAAVLWGALGLLLWVAFTLFAGTSAAHADETENPLAQLTSAVADTAEAVTEPVADVVAPVTDKVAPVVRAVTEPVRPVVEKVVAPVVTDVVAPAVPAVTEKVAKAVAKPVAAVSDAPIVGEVVTPIVKVTQDAAAPVTGILRDSPVSSALDPLLDVVSDVPVVGDVVDGIGATDLVRDVAGVVDATTPSVADAVDPTVPPTDVATAPDGPVAAPTLPGQPGAAHGTPGGPSDVVTPTTTPRSAPPITAGQATTLAAGAHAADAADAAVRPDGATTRSHERGDEPASEHAPPATPVSSSSSAWSGGVSATPNARISDAPANPKQLGLTAPAATDDALPGSPVDESDVSPD